jgi:hypothetical protein
MLGAWGRTVRAGDPRSASIWVVPMCVAARRADCQCGGVKSKRWPIGVVSKQIWLLISLSHARSLSQALVAWDPARRRKASKPENEKNRRRKGEHARKWGKKPDAGERERERERESERETGEQKSPKKGRGVGRHR